MFAYRGSSPVDPTLISALPDVIDVAYNLEINEWNSRRSVQLNVRDIRTANGA